MLNQSPRSQSPWIWLGQSLNNHGTWYDVQVATLALATEQTELVRRVLSSVPERRLARQLRPDDGQPFELMRSKSWDYSVMNLEAVFRLARWVKPLTWTFGTGETNKGERPLESQTNSRHRAPGTLPFAPSRCAGVSRTGV